MNQILDTILKDTYTLTALKHRVRILKDYLINQLFAQKQPQLDSEDLTWLTSLGSQFYKQFNKDNVYEIFSQIEAKINQLPLLNIYLSFVSNSSVSTQLGQYIRNTFGKTILFETKFDPTLIAGCALSWQGVYRDYSLRSKITEKKAEILASFKKFLQ